MNHNDVIVFLDQTGHERFVNVGQGDARRVPMPTTLREYLDDEGMQDLTHPASIAWTPKQALEVIEWLLGRDISTSPAPR